MNVHWDEAVRLQCVKPSNLASLTWKTPQFNSNQEKLFIQSADGSLNFLATAATFGTYCCVAEEGGYTEVVASFNVHPISPRSVRPHHGVNEHDVSSDADEPYEDIATEEPVLSVTPSDTEEFFREHTGDDTVTTNFRAATTIKTQDFGLNSVKINGLDLIPPSKKGAQSGNEPLSEFCEEKSYFSELVVVSLLLVICICILILGGLHMWRQSKTDNKVNSPVSPGNGEESKSMESVPSLSSPEDADPELKVV